MYNAWLFVFIKLVILYDYVLCLGFVSECGLLIGVVKDEFQWEEWWWYSLAYLSVDYLNVITQSGLFPLQISMWSGMEYGCFPIVFLRKEEGGWWSAVGIIYSFVFLCSLCSLSSHQFYEFRLVLRDSLVSVLNDVVPWVIWRQELYPYTTIIIAAFIIQTCVTYITHSFPPWQSQGSNVLTSTMSANFLIVQQFQFSYNYLQKNRFFHTFLPPLPNHPLPYFPTLINLTRLTHLHNPSHLQIFFVDFHFLWQVMDEPTVFVFDPQQEGNRVVAFVKSICILVIRLELSIRVCWYPFW